MEEIVQKLEQRTNELIRLCENIQRENEILRNDHQALRQEFKALQEKNSIAKSRVEQIIARVKLLGS